MPIRNANADEIQEMRDRLSKRQQERRYERQMDEVVKMVSRNNKRHTMACEPHRRKQAIRSATVENCAAAIGMGALYVTCAVCKSVCQSISGMDVAFLLTCGMILVLWGACAV